MQHLGKNSEAAGCDDQERLQTDENYRRAYRPEGGEFFLPNCIIHDLHGFFIASLSNVGRLYMGESTAIERGTETSVKSVLRTCSTNTVNGFVYAIRGLD